MRTPAKFSGTGPYDAWLNYLVDYIRAGRPIGSASCGVSETAAGTLLYPKAVSGSDSPGVNIKRLHFKQSLGDYFLTTEGIAVAKQPDLRCSLSGAQIYGTNWNYSYPHNPAGGGPSTDPLAYVYRTATTGSGSSKITENQGVIPPFLPGVAPFIIGLGLPPDIVYAIEMPDGTGVLSDPLDFVTTPKVNGSKGPAVPITWLHISTAKAWTKFAQQNF